MILTAISKITKRKDITDQYDLTDWRPCIRHQKKPRIVQFKAGRHTYTAAECDHFDCLCFEADRAKWNRFNPTYAEYCEYLSETIQDSEHRKTIWVMKNLVTLLGKLSLVGMPITVLN